VDALTAGVSHATGADAEVVRLAGDADVARAVEAAGGVLADRRWRDLGSGPGPVAATASAAALAAGHDRR
jgi:hypothetical protein